MPIISISKIQHRYGLSENLPQLSAAELGWAIDQRRLYIGNGPTAEGAPAIGNTEILTQYSNLLEIAENSYTYKDTAVGFAAITGQSPSSPITRSLQEKLDDIVSVRDYGAKGNGIDDDTDAINRAFKDLYTRDNREAVRRTLYFPAGLYIVSDVIKIPPYARIQGDGKDCTTIVANNNTVACVARVSDNKLQVGASVGSNGAVTPRYISVNDITFNSNTLNIDVFIINATTFAAFNRVGFKGNATTAPISAGSQLSAIQIFSTPILQSQNIIFNDCEFSGTDYAAILDDDMQNVVFDKCLFKTLYVGLKISEDTAGSGTSVYGPRGLRVTNSLFDDIYDSALVNYKTARVTSAFNTYLDVGNQTIASPSSPVIIFSGDGSASICDTFDRSDEDNLIVPRISYGNTKSIYIESNTGIQVGKRKLEQGGVITLANNVPTALITGISFTTSQKTQRIHYLATRGSNTRSGVLELTATSSGITVSDNFTEAGSDIGLTLSGSVSGSTVDVKYTSTNTGSEITFAYSVDRIIA